MSISATDYLTSFLHERPVQLSFKIVTKMLSFGENYFQEEYQPRTTDITEFCCPETRKSGKMTKVQQFVQQGVTKSKTVVSLVWLTQYSLLSCPACWSLTCSLHALLCVYTYIAGLHSLLVLAVKRQLCFSLYLKHSEEKLHSVL